MPKINITTTKPKKGIVTNSLTPTHSIKTQPTNRLLADANLDAPVRLDLADSDKPLGGQQQRLGESPGCNDAPGLAGLDEFRKRDDVGPLFSLLEFPLQLRVLFQFCQSPLALFS